MKRKNARALGAKFPVTCSLAESTICSKPAAHAEKSRKIKQESTVAQLKLFSLFG
jgi:hypothetical protein